MSLSETMEQVARGIEVIGIVTLVLGLLLTLVRTVAVEPSLEVEIDGTWPWRRAGAVDRVAGPR